MAFSELETRRIGESVGQLCRRRSPLEHRDKLEFVAEIDGHSVTVYEVRPRWNAPEEKTKLGVARFRYTRTRDEWRLYWMRRDMKWHAYDPADPTPRIEDLVGAVDNDQYGCFFG